MTKFQITPSYRIAVAGPTTQNCPECMRPNKIGATELRVTGPENQYLFGFRAIIGQECQFCGKQIVAGMDCIRKGGDEIFEKCMVQAVPLGQVIPFEDREK